MELKLVDTEEFNHKNIGTIIREHYEIEGYNVSVDIYSDELFTVDVSQKEDDNYLPEIRGSYNIKNGVLYKFTINVRYGYLTIDETKEAIKSLEQAIEVVKILTEKFVK